MKDEEVKKLFKLYLDGQTDPIQEKLLFQFIRQSEDSEKVFAGLMEQSWDEQPSVRDQSPAATAELSQIWSRIERKKEKKKVFPLALFKYAASVLLFFSAAFFWYITRKPVAATVLFITKTTGAGEKVKLILADSSVIYLNALSKLTYPDHFENNKKREIQLEGEAFFEVTHDTTRPFIVKSGKIQTQVLGTSFNIAAYPKDMVYHVAVRTGKVGVAESDEKGNLRHLSLLTRGEQLSYHLTNRQHQVESGKADDYNAWISNRFIFRNTRLSEMLVSLERNYKVSFTVKDPKLLDSRFNATFVNKNIRDIMEQLQVMSNGRLHYHINTHQTQITIGGRPLMN